MAVWLYRHSTSLNVKLYSFAFYPWLPALLVSSVLLFYPLFDRDLSKLLVKSMEPAIVLKYHNITSLASKCVIATLIHKTYQFHNNGSKILRCLCFFWPILFYWPASTSHDCQVSVCPNKTKKRLIFLLFFSGKCVCVCLCVCVC